MSEEELQQKNSQYKQAERMLKQGKYDEAINLFVELGEYEDSASYAVYATALSYCEIGDYDAAYEELQVIPDFKYTVNLLINIYYESRFFEALNAVRSSFKNPNSITVSELEIYYNSSYRAESGTRPDAPAFVITVSAQNGFGGYANTWLLMSQDDDSEKYTLIGSTTTLDMDETDELMEQLTILFIDTFKKEGTILDDAVDMNRVMQLVSSGKYTGIKRISQIGFEMFAEKLIGEHWNDEEETELQPNVW